MVGDARYELESLVHTEYVRWAQRKYITYPKWSETRDSNSQPRAPKARALANCASLRLKSMVGVPGVEPGTSALSVLRSNQLSYTPLIENYELQIIYKFVIRNFQYYFFKWSGWWVSNSQPSAWKADALANWATPADILKYYLSETDFI